MADVKITIDIDADTAAIARVRAQLKALCREVDDCADTHRKFTKQLDDLSGATRKNTKDDDDNKKGKSKLIKVVDFFSKGLRKLAMLGFKYVAIEAGAALAVIGSAGILFKTGAMLAKGYQSSLAAVSYALAAVAAAGAAFLAAQRQFQSVQFAPAFSEGAINTADRFAAASGAMKMFVDDTQMAVIGTKGLSAAFKTLNQQQAVTGKTTAVFRALSNYTAGMGGDLEKGSQSMAKFLAEFQKKKTMGDTVTEAGKELGPEFEKILKEAKKKGLTTYDKFAEAAMKGELGETFKKYSGQLDALNSTVIGRFKMAFSEIKSTFAEMGEPLLEPITKIIPRIANIIEALILRIRGNVQDIGTGSLLEGLVNVFDKVANFVGKIVTHDLSKAGTFVEGLKKMWDGVARVFEKIQDYLRPLQTAASNLWAALKPIVDAFAGNFNSTIQMLNDSLVNNKENWVSFGQSVGNFVTSIGNFGNSIKKTLIAIMPNLGKFLETIGKTMEILGTSIERAAPFLNTLLSIANTLLKIFNKLFSVISKIGSVLDVVFIGPLKALKGLTNAVLSFTALAGLGKVKSLVTGGKGGGLWNAGKKFMKPGGGMDDLRLRAMYGKEKYVRGAGNLVGKASNLTSKFFGKGVPNPAAAGGTAAALGTTAIVAGSAYGGSKVGGFVSDKLFNDDSMLSKTGGAAVGAASGGATGAAIGAGIGSLFGGIGAAPGAAIGAVVGAVFGGISGWVKAGKEKKAARKAANEIMDNYNKGMDDAIKNGDLEALQKSRSEAMIKMQELAGSNKYGAKEVKKRQEELMKLNKQVDTYISNAGNFEMFFGGDADKMNEALDLYGKGADSAKDSIINIFEVMKKGGQDVGESWSQLMGGFNQSILESRLAMFDQKDTALEAQKAVDAAQRKILEGDTSEEAITGFLKNAYKYSLSQTGGDATKATALMQKQLEYAYGPGGALSTVADKVKAGADSLRLFDPQILVDQMIASGKLTAQGKAIETISEGKISGGAAELQIQKLIAGAGEGGAAMSSKIDTLMQGYMTGKITSDQLQMALFTEKGVGVDAVLGKMNSDEGLRQSRAQAQADVAFQRGQTQVAGANLPASKQVNVGGVTIEVSGFIKDEETAKRFAKEVQKYITQYGERGGAATTAGK